MSCFFVFWNVINYAFEIWLVSLPDLQKMESERRKELDVKISLKSSGTAQYEYHRR